MRVTIYIGLSMIFIVHTSDAFKFENADCLLTLETDGISIVNHGINLLNSSIQISGRFFEALQDLYNTDKNSVSSTISNSLKEFGKTKVLSDTFELFKDVNLDKSIIYTATDFIAYYIDKKILEKHECGKKNLNEKDKTLAPFTAYLMAVLLYSPNLPKETNLTYVSLIPGDSNRFKVGTTFLWTSFGSAFMEESKMYTLRTTVVINNTKESKWSPRRLEKYSFYPGDPERTYPPGAMFRVTGKSRQGQLEYIYADLISED